MSSPQRLFTIFTQQLLTEPEGMWERASWSWARYMGLKTPQADDSSPTEEQFRLQSGQSKKYSISPYSTADVGQWYTAVWDIPRSVLQFIIHSSVGCGWHTAQRRRLLIVEDTTHLPHTSAAAADHFCQRHPPQLPEAAHPNISGAVRVVKMEPTWHLLYV